MIRFMQVMVAWLAVTALQPACAEEAAQAPAAEAPVADAAAPAEQTQASEAATPAVQTEAAETPAVETDAQQPQAAEAQTGEVDAPQDAFPPEQIEQLVAPIALYPDALLAQIMMASTYPLDIVQASRWVKEHDGLKGEDLEKAAEQEPWDPSVKALVFFPDVLGFMSDNLDWTQDLGDAVLAQQDDVTDAVQRLRAEATEAGSLQTTEQQRVEEVDNTIIVQPTDPEVVYVPTYNPSTVYGQTAPPETTYYPATYTTQPSTVVVSDSSSSADSWLTFGAGAVVGGLLTGAIMWNNNRYDRVYYGGRGHYHGRPYYSSSNYWSGGWKNPKQRNVNRNISTGDITVNKGLSGSNVNRAEVKKWQHNPNNRGGVRYRNKETAQRFSNASGGARIDRDVARGRDPNRQRAGLAGRSDIKPSDRKELKRLSKEGVKAPDKGSLKRDIKRPDSKRPVTQPAKQAKRPAAKQAKRPAAKQAKAPKTRSAKVSPKTRQAAAKTKNRPAKASAKRPVKRDGGKSSAFKQRSGGGDRAASRRGKASRGGGRSGGGGRARRGRG